MLRLLTFGEIYGKVCSRSREKFFKTNQKQVLQCEARKKYMNAIEQFSDGLKYMSEVKISAKYNKKMIGGFSPSFTIMLINKIAKLILDNNIYIEQVREIDGIEDYDIQLTGEALILINKLGEQVKFPSTCYELEDECRITIENLYNILDNIDDFLSIFKD